MGTPHTETCMENDCAQTYKCQNLVSSICAWDWDWQTERQKRQKERDTTINAIPNKNNYLPYQCHHIWWHNIHNSHGSVSPFYVSLAVGADHRLSKWEAPPTGSCHRLPHSCSRNNHCYEVKLSNTTGLLTLHQMFAGTLPKMSDK